MLSSTQVTHTTHVGGTSIPRPLKGLPKVEQHDGLYAAQGESTQSPSSPVRAVPERRLLQLLGG